MVGWVKRCLLKIFSAAGVPRHIAFIMDGNRRWATQRHKAKHEGHDVGMEKLMEVLDWCLIAGVSQVTVFALSVENLQRPPEEVKELMRLIRELPERMNRRGEYLKENGIRVRIAGDMGRLGEAERVALEKIATSTVHNSAIVLNICVAYSGMEEMIHAISGVQQQVSSGLLSPK